MPHVSPVSHLLCGKIASGKSTLAAALSQEAGVIVISEDQWLKTLFGDDMKTGADYLRFSSRLQAAMAPHVKRLLQSGLSVVLDFPANTIAQRAWMRELVTESDVDHQLHVLDVPDDVCLARLRQRNADGVHAFAATEAQFHRFAQHFVPPTPEEGFTIIRH